MRTARWLMAASGFAMVAASAQAQVSRPTAADLAPLPSFFKPDKNGRITFDSDSTVKRPPGAAEPSADPRNLAGTYDSMFGYSGSAIPAEAAAGPGGARPGAPPGGLPGAGGPGGGPDIGTIKFGAVKPGTSFNRGLCEPAFNTGSGFHPGAIIQTATDIVLLRENSHDIQHIYLNAAHPKRVVASAYGDATGRWEGTTLVVDVVGLNRHAGGDGGGPGPRIAYADDTHVTERISKLSNGDLRNVITAVDASTGKALGGETVFLHWRPDLPLLEDICEDFAEAYGSSYSGTKAPDLNADKVAP